MSIECAGEQLGFAGDGSMSLRGVVCYRGTVPGSLAVYRCPTDFQFSGNSSVQYRVCQLNGLWSNEVPICTPASSSSKYILLHEQEILVVYVLTKNALS